MPTEQLDRTKVKKLLFKTSGYTQISRWLLWMLPMVTDQNLRPSLSRLGGGTLQGWKEYIPAQCPGVMLPCRMFNQTQSDTYQSERRV